MRLLLYQVSIAFRDDRLRMHYNNCITTSRLLAAFCAAWLSLQLLNKSSASQNLVRHVDSIGNRTIEGSREIERPKISKVYATPYNYAPLAGKTMDLTLFAATRAVETVIGDIWLRHKSFGTSNAAWMKFQKLVSSFTDASVFAISSGVIMWSWIYHPNALPRAYNKWIGAAAQVDPRLILLLRKARVGQFVYGHSVEKDSILESMCRDFKWPLKWGDPSKTIPIPCEMVHSGLGPSCSWHAMVRFSRAFKFALLTYLPLQIFMGLKKPSLKSLWRALREAMRSSAFLGAFVGLFWSGICLSRTRLGPKLLDNKRVTPLMWDQGLCIRAGCVLCGWSILIETARRRQEVAFFVAPKAAATYLPRRYDRKYLWREKAAFSVSIAILFTFAQQDPAKVRGMLGRLLHQVLE
ncbi:hypothetical protein MMC07_007351 [Pseudocyphellaria aurata]|nr:hypothetical protein [Pseudocyphellaria aurata]